MTNFLSSLNTNGYYIFRNVISNYELDMGRNAIYKTTVNYYYAEKYIRNIILNKVPLEVINSKYRISNNNNSNDAAALHRDLIVVDGKNPPPVFTILNYLDTSVIELIPKSHLKINCNYQQATELFLMKKRIKIYPNDILIFYATLMHRGIFTDTKQVNRRLIQLFDCIPKNMFNSLNSQILHLPCSNNCWNWFSNSMITISKIPILINILNFIDFYNVARGYGQHERYQIKISKLHGYTHKYLSTEANNQRLWPTYNGNEIINRYIIKKNINDRDPSSTESFRFYLNTYLTLIHLLFFIVIIILICLKIKSLVTQGSKK